MRRVSRRLLRAVRSTARHAYREPNLIAMDGHKHASFLDGGEFLCLWSMGAAAGGGEEK